MFDYLLLHSYTTERNVLPKGNNQFGAIDSSHVDTVQTS